MKKFVLGFLFFLTFFLNTKPNCQELSCQKNKLHVCTVASKRTKGLRQLIDSCRRYYIYLDVLGLDKPYRGNCEKVIHIKNYLNTLPDDDIVMFVDGYDTLVLADKETILKKFFKMKAPFVISVEKYCWPISDRASEFPKSPTSFKYINSGTYIGYVGYIKKLLNELSFDVNRHKSDQGRLILHFLKNPEKYSFDYNCELFLAMPGMIEQDLEISKEKSSVKCKETNTFPSVIHGAGSGFSLYQKIYDELFINNPFHPPTNDID